MGRSLFHIPKFAMIGIMVIVMSLGWGAFKRVEPAVLPVVENFQVDEAHRIDGSVYISGSMDKRRDCEFRGVIVYAGKRLASIGYAEQSEADPVVSRLKGEQLYGPWKLTPSVDEIYTITAVHDCWTGKVTTHLFNGKLVETESSE